MIALVNESGGVVERYAYDPWGRRRNPDDWTQFDDRTDLIVNRGYTMHEHLSPCGGAGGGFGVINMNGRVYDPLTAQFYSPDPFIQAPDNWLNYNRYAYCLNNPFKYTDPSGYLFGIDDMIVLTIGLAVFQSLNQGMISYMQGGSFWKGAAIGAATGLISYGVGYGVGQLLGTTSFIGGFATNFASGFAGSATNAWLNGKSVSDGLKEGLINGGIGGLIGGLTNGFDAVAHKGNFWTGGDAIYDQIAISSAKQVPKTEQQYDDFRIREGDIYDEILKDKYASEFNLKEGDVGVKKITTQAMYEKGHYMSTTGYFTDDAGSKIKGFTYDRGFGHTSIHISPTITLSDINTFRITAGHELIHAIHINTGLLNGSVLERDYSETVAYKFSINTALQSSHFAAYREQMQVAISKGYTGLYPTSYNISLLNQIRFNLW